MIATPFLFYIYKYAPSEEGVTWNTFIGVIEPGNFSNVQSYMHALFTKTTFVLLTTIWFVTSRNWWKYAILVPLTMFLFQLSGVINHQIQFIDEFDFWYSIPVIIPILLLLIFISYKISKRNKIAEDLNEDAVEEVKKLISDDL
ncbi:hypothetical protein G5B37_11705 [Rasiella rasia]|uniref:Uncharacterized protein n=1 Tax=Rasiella rasia TaxID=2744027 RepID=A0A6G6GP02_9FLAO|nr:hypothetical protein [Rasiella rasia]QIE60200.1 hypothetical protein G5B37_11705 [Rasiella rasia]